MSEHRLPRGPRLDPQHVPTVFTISDSANGVGLFFGETSAAVRGGTFPAILT